MAPLPQPTLLTYITSLLKRTTSPTASPPTPPSLLTRSLTLFHRTTPTSGIPNPGYGVTPPSNIPNKAVFALFGLIGVGFVLTGIWFFFWARNGGFYFRETDWDDYKSTVLRRKGPNGTTLSGATESTDLGGGSVVHGQGRGKWGKKKKKEKRYKDFDLEEATEYTGVGTEYTGDGGTEYTPAGSEMSEATHKLKTKTKKSKAKEAKDKFKRKAKKTNTALTSDVASTIGSADVHEEIDVGVRNTIRSYRHEKPARVGGLNKPSDASAFDGSTADASSDLLSHRERTPTSTPKKERAVTGGIRKVVSTSEGGGWSRGGDEGVMMGSGSPSAKKPLITNTDDDIDGRDSHDHIRAEARRLQEKGRAAAAAAVRRDFSYTPGDDSTIADEEAGVRRAERRRKRRDERERERIGNGISLPGSFVEESEGGSCVSSDVGTKSYHHPIPGLGVSGRGSGSEDAFGERRERRKGGYRRE